MRNLILGFTIVASLSSIAEASLDISRDIVCYSRSANSTIQVLTKRNLAFYTGSVRTPIECKTGRKVIHCPFPNGHHSISIGESTIRGFENRDNGEGQLYTVYFIRDSSEETLWECRNTNP